MSDPIGIAARFAGVRLVSWDVDNTLFSTRRVAWRVMRNALAETLRARVSMWRELRALAAYQRRVRVAAKRGGIFAMPPERSALRRVEESCYGPAIGAVGPRPGTKAVVERLAALGIRQVAFSNYEADYKLQALGLHGFAGCYAGETLGTVKPHPGVLQRIAADFALSAADILHIGDRIDLDEASARAAGCRCLILGRDFADMHELLAELTSLPRSPGH